MFHGEMQLMQDLHLTQQVCASGLPNRFSYRIPVTSKLNIKNIKKLSQNYHKKDIIEWLEFGFSMSRDPEAPDPVPVHKNHKGALEYPEAVDDYLTLEMELGATMGPFSIPPFCNRIGISPLNTRPK